MHVSAYTLPIVPMIYMKYKFPRIAHCPWSENVFGDDKVHSDMSLFEGQDVRATVKMDGENTNLACDYIHARSLEYPNHESRTWMKQFWSTIKKDIPEGYRISGENLYAKHSIHYLHLKSYFYVFAIWNENNIAINWDDTCYWADLLGLTMVPTIYHGPFDRQKIHTSFNAYCKQSPDPVEGYVIRISHKEIPYNEVDKNRCFKSLCKWVRKDHVTTEDHWMNLRVVPNELEKIGTPGFEPRKACSQSKCPEPG